MLDRRHVRRISRSVWRRSMNGCTDFDWIGPGRMIATWIVRSSRFSGRVRSSVCICARDSIWNVPTVSALWISVIHARVVERDPREVDRLAVHSRDLLDAVLDRGEHPEPEQVDLQEARVRARVLVPLHHLAARPSRTAARGRARRAAATRSPCRRDAARCGAAGRRSPCTARRTRASAASAACDRRPGSSASSSRTRFAFQPSVTRASRSSSANGSRAPCRRRGSRRASGTSRTTRRARRARARTSRSRGRSASRGCRAESRGRCPAPTTARR